VRFSIIITSHNQRRFIRDAVDSALSIQHADREIIVVDDASSDGSQDILRSYGQAIRLVCRETNGGAGVARNSGASVATGEYLVFLDGDDSFLPWALDVYQRIVELKKPKMILGSMQWFRGVPPALRAADSPQAMQIVDYQDYMHKDRPFGNSASALVIDRRSFQAVHGWPEELFPLEDQDLVIRLGDSGRTIQILSPVTVLHREHGANTVHHVAPFLAVLSRMIERERLGEYPGGKPRRFERYGLLGGLVFFWAKRAVKRGLYGQAAALLAQGWPMLFAAIARKFNVILTGRRPCETIAV
jgi:glycosyltransferase involved in cell wall biosynthesis